MSVVVPLQAGEKLKQGDLMQKYDGKLYPVADWQGRTAQGSLYYREYSDIVPMGHCYGTGGRNAHVITIDDPLCRPLEPHVYYRLAEPRDIGKPAWFSDFPRTQEYLLEHAPNGKGKLLAFNGNVCVCDLPHVPNSRFAYVREEVKRFEIVQVTKKQEFRLARLSDIGRNAIVSDIPIDNQQLAVDWNNRPRSNLTDVNFDARLPYKTKASGLRFRFAWVPVE